MRKVRKRAGLRGKGREKEKEAGNCLQVPIATAHWRQDHMMGARRLLGLACQTTGLCQSVHPTQALSTGLGLFAPTLPDFSPVALFLPTSCACPQLSYSLGVMYLHQHSFWQAQKASALPFLKEDPSFLFLFLSQKFHLSPLTSLCSCQGNSGGGEPPSDVSVFTDSFNYSALGLSFFFFCLDNTKPNKTSSEFEGILGVGCRVKLVIIGKDVKCWEGGRHQFFRYKKGIDLEVWG